MFEKTITVETKRNLEILSSGDLIDNFYLAGGTGAALQLGHRTSEDLDFFSKDEFFIDRLINFLKESGDLKIDKKSEDTLSADFNGTRISFFYYSYPVLEIFKSFLNIKLASLIDIACMKIDSISSRGLKRDFVDLFFIVKSGEKDLSEFLSLFEIKYSKVKYNMNHIKKSLIYFDDADKEPDPKMLVSDFSWEEAKRFFEKEARKIT